MNPTQLVTPEIAWGDLVALLALLGGTCVLLLLGSLIPRWPRYGNAVLTIATAVVAFVATATQWNKLSSRGGFTIVGDAITVDRFSVFATMVILLSVVLASLLMSVHADPINGDPLERYALLLTSAIGAIVMVSANELIVLFLALEILSLSLYLMAVSYTHLTLPTTPYV